MSVERRAARLLRCYPRGWRARYEDEFTQLVLDQMADGSWSLTRSLDVLGHGLLARLTYSGLLGSVIAGERRTRALLGVLAGVALLFGLLAVGVWSQLAIGWQWSAPTDQGTRAGMWMMSVALFALASVLVLTAIPVASAVLIRLLRGDRRRLGVPALASLGAAVLLYLGCRHFGAHWPGTGGHPWAGRSLVPAWAARLAWAGTAWITSYWAHPKALQAFPAREIAWMVISPLAWLTLCGSVITTVRRVDLTPRLQYWTVVMATVAVGSMAVFLAGAVMWVLAGTVGPRNLFAVGTIDIALTAVMTIGMVVATHLVRRASGSIRVVS
jgi:hypothetical protein